MNQEPPPQNHARLKASMREHLTDPKVAAHLQERVKAADQALTTSIQEAAEIAAVTENQLRYWEDLKLLSPQRTSSKNKGQGQRRYGLREFTNLAVINELLKNGYDLSDIVDVLRHEENFLTEIAKNVSPPWEEHQDWHQSMPNQISRAEKALFWRAFIARAIYFSICLLFEQIPNGDVGVFLPLKNADSQEQQRLEGMEDVLIGWHSRSHPFCTFLVKQLTSGVLEFLNPYQFIPLDWSPDDSMPVMNVHLAVEKHLARSLRKEKDETVKAIRRLFHLLQETASEWQPYLQSTGDYTVYNSPTSADPNAGDRLIAEMAEMVVQLGGMKQEKRELRWRFSCIFLPTDSTMPLQQRTLILRAQSKDSPHQVDKTTVIPNQRPPGVCLVAFQSGQVVYRPKIADYELDIYKRAVEEPISSAIAVPIEGEYGEPLGALYIIADEPDAFSDKGDLLLLRMMGRIIGELLLVYRARHLLVGNLSEMLVHPKVVDSLLSDFDSEGAFVERLEGLLEQTMEEGNRPFQELSFIAVNIDNASGKAVQYGDLAERNLIRAVGQRIQEWIIRHKKSQKIHLYYMYADRFYLMLKDIPLAEAKEYANHLRQALKNHPFRIKATLRSQDQPIPHGYRLEITITVHLAVTGYKYQKLKSMLLDDPKPTNIRAKLIRTLDEALRMGRDGGGDNVVFWDRNGEGFVRQEDAETATRSSDTGSQESSPSSQQAETQLPQALEDALRALIREELGRPPTPPTSSE